MTTDPAAGARPRVDLVDWLRGLVMVLMALDHTRDFVGDLSVPATDAGRTTVPLFATRWVTHLCAPTFCFLAGAGGWMTRARGRTTGGLSWFLLTRGLWMIVLEVTVVKACWSLYAPDYGTVGLAVFAALGAGMAALAGLVWLPRPAVGLIGLAVVAGHNALDGVKPGDLGAWAGAWKVLHAGGPVPVADGFRLFAAYPLLPWAGVMAVGYAAGGVFGWPRPARRRALAAAGAGCLLAFLVLRGGNLYGDPEPWQPQAAGWRTVLAVLDCEKYPPSLAYLLATLGLAALAAAAVDRPGGPPGRWVVTFGRVPLFFYLLHLPVIHLFAAGVYLAGRSAGWYGPVDEELMRAGLRTPLAGVYLTWAAVVYVLFWPCRWFAGVKRRGRSPLLGYL